MKYDTITEIYEANDKIREKLKNSITDLNDEQANFLPADESWTIANIVEHLALVEEGMIKICAKLLREAQIKGVKANGEAKISRNFLQKIAESRNQKVEAPERVRPTGTKTVSESLAKMDENRQRLKEIRPLFETVECSDYKFPHPVFGDLTAHEWLVLLGGHEWRHIQQIKRLLEKIGQN
jgi:uncharacterized damage-inducible protein DinB